MWRLPISPEKTSLLVIVASILTLAAHESHADTVTYNFAGIVYSSELADFTPSEAITISFTLDTSVAATIIPPNQATYPGAVTSFQFGPINLDPPYSSSVGVADNFYNNVGYVDGFTVEADLADGSGALMFAQAFGSTPQSFITSLAIPTAPNFALADNLEFVYYNGSGEQVDAFLAAAPLPAGLALFATGLGALGLLGWRRRRKAT